MQSLHHMPEVIPAARVEQLVATETSSEVLIYDMRQHHIHKLNSTTSVVWRLCDGRRTLAEAIEMASDELGSQVDELTFRLALTKLDEADLLAQPLRSVWRTPRLTRRAFLQRTAVAGAIAVPAIVSTTAPITAQGFSVPDTCGTPCNNSNGCTVRGIEGSCPHCAYGFCVDAHPQGLCGTRCNNDNQCKGGDPCAVCGSAGYCVEGSVDLQSKSSEEEQSLAEQAEAERIAAEQAEAERIAAEQAEAEQADETGDGN